MTILNLHIIPKIFVRELKSEHLFFKCYTLMPNYSYKLNPYDHSPFTSTYKVKIISRKQCGIPLYHLHYKCRGFESLLFIILNSIPYKPYHIKYQLYRSKGIHIIIN